MTEVSSVVFLFLVETDMSDFLKVSSKENHIIKKISSLQKSSKERKNTGLFVLEGLRLCADACINGFVPETVIVSENAFSKYHTDISKYFSTSSQKIILTDSLFSKISDTVSPQGILCLFKIPHFDCNSLVRNGKYIALENLQDPSNLGAISRTAEALGIDGLIVCGGCDPYSSKSLRASMGALLRLPIFETQNVFDLIDGNGYKTYAAVVSDATDYVGNIKFEKGTVAFIGNEANGLTDTTIAKCDYKITIPMNGRAESLNAGVAASIIMWEMSKC